MMWGEVYGESDSAVLLSSCFTGQTFRWAINDHTPHEKSCKQTLSLTKSQPNKSSDNQADDCNGKMNIVKGYFNPFIHFKFPNWPKSTKFQNLNSKLSPEKSLFFLYNFLFFFLKCSRFQMHSFSPIFSFILKHTMIFTKQCN